MEVPEEMKKCEMPIYCILLPMKKQKIKKNKDNESKYLYYIITSDWREINIDGKFEVPKLSFVIY
jgi:hypothetical protein